MKKIIILISLILTTSPVLAESEFGPEFDLYSSGYTEDGWWFAPSGFTYKNIDEPIDYGICMDYKVYEWTLCKEILKSRGYRFHNTLNDIDVSEIYEDDFELAKRVKLDKS